MDVVEAHQYWSMKADRDRWEILARYLCEMLETTIPEEIAELFPDPLLAKSSEHGDA